jgi:hypothetical protein
VRCRRLEPFIDLGREVTTVSNAADDLWEEMDRESDEAEAEERNRPDRDEPWAKTSSGDTDKMTSD